MTAPIAPPKHKPPVLDGKLWKAARVLYLRDGTEYAVGRVLHVDTHHLVIVPVGSEELVLVPKHSVDRALLHRERFAKGGAE